MAWRAHLRRASRMRGGYLGPCLLAVACGASEPDAPGASAGHGGGAGASESAGKPAAGGTSSGAAGRASVGGSGGRSAAGASAGNDNGVGGAASGAAGRSGAPSVVSYSTTFDTSESPLAERGAWHHEGVDWTIVQTTAGIAYGTQALGVSRSGPEGYNDSYAYLAGFPADQRASAEIAMATIDPSCTHEVEILLRWFDSEHVARGYECNLAFDGSYAQIVRWNGPVGDYTYLGEGSVPGGVRAGDVISASVVGSHITLSVNGTVRATADDSTFADGNPGIGFWRGSSGCGNYADFGFVSFEASGVE